MPPPAYTGLWGYLYDWQALIAGVLALFAGVGTVWATIKSADREISAAQAQTMAAQQQTEAMRAMENSRIARERCAFWVVVEAAMGSVIEDVEAAGRIFEGSSSTSDKAYEARQRIKRAGFAELRGAFLLFGASIYIFLQLDKEIEDFAGQWSMPISPTTNSPLPPLGVSAGVRE